MSSCRSRVSTTRASLAAAAGYLHIVFEDDGVEAGKTEEGRQLPKMDVNNEPGRFRYSGAYALESPRSIA